MKRLLLTTTLIVCAGRPNFGQPQDADPKFEAADVHVSAKTTNQFARTSPARSGRYEIRTATLVDLIRIAYGFDADKIVGGPSWLEMDRFDVIAKAPDDSNAETHKLMLQSLLKDRFKLALHKDTRPLPTYALTVGKKPQMKEAEGSEESGCKIQTASGPPAEGGGRLMMAGPNGGAPLTVNLGPGMTVQYMCRNITMGAFTAALRTMIGNSLGTNPVVDETGLKGNWNFDLKYSIQLNGGMMDQSERISILTAVDKQLGLKLEEKPVPTPVLVVDSVNRKPVDNAPNIAEILPPIAYPTEFEVASIKLSDPNRRMSRYQMQPGGRLLVEGVPLRFLISRAFNTNNNDQIVGLPEATMTDRYDIIAKTPSGGPQISQMDMDAIAPMMLSLLVDRFKMKYHKEDRPVTAYSLVSVKPKMKKADPESRTWCKYRQVPPPGSPPGSQMLACQNATMALFADRLQGMTPDLNWPVVDTTEIEGGWDFTLTYNIRFPMMMAVPAGRGGGEAGAEGPGPLPLASDPAGGITIFEAIEKQLGLKLEKQKRSVSVIVIEHIEPKPTEN